MIELNIWYKTLKKTYFFLNNNGKNDFVMVSNRNSNFMKPNSYDM